jgi:hypothetical protein
MAIQNRHLILAGAFTAIVPTLLLFLGVNSLFIATLLIGSLSMFIGWFIPSDPTRNNSLRFGMLALCAVVTVSPFALSAYFERTGYPITIVVPEDFVGDFSIVRHREIGIEPQFEDGHWVFRIPESGSLTISDDHPFYVWHSPIKFVDSIGRPRIGESLGTTGGSVKTGPSTWSGSTDHDGTSHSFSVESTR